MSQVTHAPNDGRYGEKGSPITEVSDYLSFRIGLEEYGIGLRQVQEIRGYDRVTQLANAPAYLKGVVNLRGIIVPIIDLRLYLGMAEPSYDQFTVVIVLNVADQVIGIVVDGVSDVLRLSPEQIRPAPEFGTQLDTAYIEGLATLDEGLLILIGIETLLASRELGLLPHASA